jgi:sterol desaturase/sphingolipid hydroxylase (fatty acid hydroxylase superfamily)
MSSAAIFWQTLWEQGLGFLDPEKRIFYGAVITALIGSWVWLYRYGSASKRSWSQSFRHLLTRRVLWSRSSQLDLQLYFVNALVKVFLVTPWALSSVTVAYAVYNATSSIAEPLVWPWWLIASAFSVVLFTLDDFSRFFVHRLMHRAPWLWHFHALHHSATTLSPLTLFRVHPVESLLMSLRHAMVLGLVSGFFLAFFSDQLTGWDILGVDALGFVFNMSLANLRHSHIPISFGSLEKWFLSPKQHQIHHSHRQEHFDKNYGVCFALWDRWYGTWLSSRNEKIFRFGLNRGAGDFRTLWSAYLGPFAKIAAKISIPEIKKLQIPFQPDLK